MSLAEIEEQVRPLTRAEKEQRIKDIQQMLDEEELSRIFPPGKVFEIHSVPIHPDDQLGQAGKQREQVPMN